LQDEPVVDAGQINPSDAPAPVLQAILAGESKKEMDPTFNINNSDVATLAASIAAELTANGPYMNRADLATRMGPVVSGTAGSVAFNTTSSGNINANWANKAYAEAPMRALSDVTNTRTWNLMIDVVAQTGNFAPGATDLSKGFVVEGERRYWLHIAIDRFTGAVIDQQLEPVYE
jgi:hypothetical protein